MNILMVYAYSEYPFRSTTWEHLRSFEKYSGCHIFYLNLINGSVPWYARTVDFDLVIFDTLFLSRHWHGPQYFSRLLRRARPIKDIRAVKVMLPQDEFLYSDLYCEFIREFGISIVFSVAPESEWRRIYSSVDFTKTTFHRVLPGYLDDAKLPLLIKLGRNVNGRPINIGYRTAGRPHFWFGRHGYLKQRIADEVLAAAKIRNLPVDISTSGANTIHGDAWYEYLSSCRYTIGSEGGTSMIDPDGSIRARVDQFLRAHPEADFGAVEQACFPGVDGTCMLLAISPRHLEACATRTCQILVEGTYNGILVAGRHYIPIKTDLSNVGEVLDTLGDESIRHEIIDNAYKDIVEAGNYTYSAFVRFVLERSLPDGARPEAGDFSSWERLVYSWMCIAERAQWRWFRLRSTLKKVRHEMLGR